MSTTPNEQLEQLRKMIAEMESQRAVLGDETVTAALIPLQEKLLAIEIQVERPKPEIPTQQRKLATILFMDVVGSTELTRGLDPEDQMELIDPLIARLAEKVSEFGGHVARFQGDGFKAVFGLPLARENDPEQAIRAGLAIQAEASEIAVELEREHSITGFKVRAGISTGLVFAGGDTEGEDTIKGDPVNLAARLESAAQPGELLISHDTYRHVRGVFNVDPLEPISAKGFPELVPVYLVREVKPRAFRVLTRGVEGVETRMVGREAELKCLQDALLTAFEEGEGQVITISGEAGVGKSRLLYEFQNWIELLPSSQSVWLFPGRGRQEAQGLPYSLLRDLFSFRFQILEGHTGQQARKKFESGFCDVFGENEEGAMKAHILGQLLGFDFSASSHLKGVLNDAEQLRNRGLMYLVQYFQALAQELPVVIFLEDAHWADDSSLDLVSRLGEYTLQHPWLIVCAARPSLFERRPYWGEGQAYHSRLELSPLSRRESRQLVAEILKLVEQIPNELRELVAGGAEGNPFYTEELIKMLIEQGVIIPGEETWGIDLSSLMQIDIPSTLAGVLQARLDGLPQQERTVLQQASVVGRLFWDRIVAYIQAEGGNGVDPQLIPQTLTSLRNRELVYRHEESEFVGAVEYLFKHDVLREVTYESVLKRLRKTYHGLVADWLIANCEDRIGEYSGLIADHLLLAGRKTLAGDYFKQAGDFALASYANTEAEGYYRQALGLIPNFPFRADLLTGLGESLSRQGKNDETKLSWQKAIDIYKDLGDSNSIADLYTRLSKLLWDREGYQKAWNVCQEGLDLMIGAPDSTGYAQLLAEAGRIAYLIVLLDEVRPLCQRAIDMSERIGAQKIIVDARITIAFIEEHIPKTIAELEDVIKLAEEQGITRSASRAHLNLGNFLAAYLFDVESAHQHYLRAAEIQEQIGEIDLGIFYANACEAAIWMGQLNYAEQIISNFYARAHFFGTRNEYYFNVVHTLLLFTRGNWKQSLELNRILREELRQGEFIQSRSSRNLEIANAILELNRFGSFSDLDEAENALEENIEFENIYFLESIFLLVNVYLRKNRKFAAKEQYAIAQDRLSPADRDNNLVKELCANAEFEFAIADNCWDDAIQSCRTSIEIYKNCCHRWGWARKLIDLGDAYLGRGDPGELELAKAIYQQSLDMFTEMGAPGYIKVLEERLENPGRFPPGTRIGD